LLIIVIGCAKSDKQPVVSKIVIHYVDWRTLTEYSWSCEDVVSAGDSVVILDQSEVSRLEAVFDESQLTLMPGHIAVDTRICVRFYDEADTISKTVAVTIGGEIEIDGRVFEPNQVLFDLVVSYLPEEHTQGWKI
jgi:hypothetical protein